MGSARKVARARTRSSIDDSLSTTATHSFTALSDPRTGWPSGFASGSNNPTMCWLPNVSSVST